MAEGFENLGTGGDAVDQSEKPAQDSSPQIEGGFTIPRLASSIAELNLALGYLKKNNLEYSQAARRILQSYGYGEVQDTELEGLLKIELEKARRITTLLNDLPILRGTLGSLIGVDERSRIQEYINVLEAELAELVRRKVGSVTDLYMAQVVKER